MTIKLYNTCTRKKEEFIPRQPGKVDMYVCGPTTYNLIHLGNARPLIVFDTVRRYFEYKGYQVTYVQNFTDIDDKIINRAREKNTDPITLAAKYIREYFKDAAALGVREATVHPRVSEHLDEIIEMIRGIMKNGYAYQLDGDVYFSVESFKGYGKLSGRSLEDMQAGARVDVDTRKRHPMDFALWKAAKPGEPAWDSPWGKGRPGWHIECSAMANKYLGMGFDIHGGGFDLIFPHHENEIAQAEAYAGCGPFARYWMHNGFITVNEEKMSKSLGNFFTVREILAKYDPEVVRFYMLSTHYRSPLDFDDTKLEMNRKSLSRLHNALDNIESILKTNKFGEVENPELEKALADLLRAREKAVRDFEEAMDDDFNTALAIAVLFDLARDSNAFIHAATSAGGDALLQEVKGALQQVFDTFMKLGQVLGLFEKRGTQGDAGLVDRLMQIILDIRSEARARKDWATADGIRNKLNELGIIIEDSPQGARWKRK
ncbi:cysteinyl-tRNA synthetase [Thermincola ferriacetica]|uniref:Cysteine--tRNA ligase n=1 Tax=Thermincola ferriacetica TaxID=281456 RepID=A0A0L6W1U5_9FIRM|nr:cysteine--tRNA ligase [Thermincola ferriacetica]KNZ69505.1 cysteinyl-tRNA synthetase [Thermincola ferriacetica]